MPVDIDDTDSLAELLAAAAEGGLRDAPVGALNDNAVGDEPRTAFDWLSRDDAEVDRYLADPMCGDGNPLTSPPLAAPSTCGATRALATSS